MSVFLFEGAGVWKIRNQEFRIRDSGFSTRPYDRQDGCHVYYRSKIFFIFLRLFMTLYVSSWSKHGYVCIHLPRKTELTVVMDIKKNPVPLRTTNQDYSASSLLLRWVSSFDNIFITSFLIATFYLFGIGTDLFEIRLESFDVRPGIEQLFQLKRSSLLRYRGNRSVQVTDYRNCLNSSNAVL